MIRTILLLAILVVATNDAVADEYGPYLCDGCLLGGPYPDGDTQAFIELTANHFDDGDYEMGDTVVICSDGECATYERVFFGFFLLGIEPDEGGPYVNEPDGSGGDGSNNPTGGGGKFRDPRWNTICIGSAADCGATVEVEPIRPV